MKKVGPGGVGVTQGGHPSGGGPAQRLRGVGGGGESPGLGMLLFSRVSPAPRGPGPLPGCFLQAQLELNLGSQT